MTMKDNVFRKYDIRGVVGNELLIGHIYDLGQAIMTYLHGIHPSATTVVIGRDGREHSPAIHAHLVQAIIDLGFSVVDVGIVHTPAVYFSVYHLQQPCALMITASHNPKEYNGIKIWGVSGEGIQRIRKLYQEKRYMNPLSDRPGEVSSVDIITPYVAYFVNHFPSLRNATLNAVIDCGNGATGAVMPQLIKAMGWRNVEVLFADIDSSFPHHEADPTVLKNMLTVQTRLSDNDEYTVGIGFDGDGDRMNPMTKKGFLVPGDHLLALYAQPILHDHPGAAVVFDIKSSSSLVDLLETWGAQPVVSPSGHSFIKKAIREHQAVLGGELSCHFFFNDRYFGYDDGVYAACRLLELLHETKKTLDELLHIIPVKESSPEIRLMCTSEEIKRDVVAQVKQVLCARKDATISMLDGIKMQMPYGWGLLRASNTQPVICLRFESSTKEGLRAIKLDFFHELSPYFSSTVLKEAFAL